MQPVSIAKGHGFSAMRMPAEDVGFSSKMLTFLGDSLCGVKSLPEGCVEIQTTAGPEEWVIKTPNEQLFPCSPEDFPELASRLELNNGG